MPTLSPDLRKWASLLSFNGLKMFVVVSHKLPRLWRSAVINVTEQSKANSRITALLPDPAGKGCHFVVAMQRLLYTQHEVFLSYHYVGVGRSLRPYPT